jgi:hypothetical protein
MVLAAGGSLRSIPSSRCKRIRAGGISRPSEIRLLARAADRSCWWSQTGSNRRPPACKAGALPTELWPRPEAVEQSGTREDAAMSSYCCLIVVGLGRLERPTSRLSGVRSNHLSYRPDAKRTFSHENASSCLKKEKRRRRNPALF